MPSAAVENVHHGRWGSTWRIAVLAVVGLLCTLIVHGSALESVPIDSPAADAIAVRMLADLTIGIIALVLVGFRHRMPLLVPCLVIAASAVSALAAPAAAVLLISVVAGQRRRRIIIVGALFFTAGCISGALDPLAEQIPIWQLVAMIAIVEAALIAIGLFIGARRRLRAQQMRSIAAEQTARIERAQRQERTRIAREMHDVLGHRLSLIAVHAGALEYRDDLTREQTAQAASAIRESSHRGLEDLRDVLGVLRSDVGAEPESGPQPRVQDLPTLIETVRATGATVVVDALETDDIPDSTGRQLFRIVQELLTNARRHAPSTPVRLRLTARQGDGVRLVVRNASSAPRGAEGYGLIGIAERAQHAGGSMTIDEGDGMFAVEVVLPWPM